MFSAFWALDIAPTLDVLVLFFFRQTTISLWLGHFSYNRNYWNYYHKAKSGQRKLVQKSPPFIFYYFNVTYKTGRD